MLRKRKWIFKKEDMQKRGEKPNWNKLQHSPPLLQKMSLKRDYGA